MGNTVKKTFALDTVIKIKDNCFKNVFTNEVTVYMDKNNAKETMVEATNRLQEENLYSYIFEDPISKKDRIKFSISKFKKDTGKIKDIEFGVIKGVEDYTVTQEGALKGSSVWKFKISLPCFITTKIEDRFNKELSYMIEVKPASNGFTAVSAPEVKVIEDIVAEEFELIED